MSSPSGAVRVALVGYGLGGSHFHAPFIDAEPRLELAAVVTSSSERRAEVASRYPGTRVIESVESLMDQLASFDLVVVSTPPASHAVVAEQVLRQGRPVVVDKPATPSSKQTRHLAALAEANGTAIVPYQNRRWDGDFRTVVQLLGDDALGALHTFESRYERWQPRLSGARTWKNEPGPDAGTGIIFDLGTHIIDQAVALFGRPLAVYADVATRRPESHVDDDVFLALDYHGGTRVQLWASALAADQGPRFRLLGSEAAYVKFGMDTQEAQLAEGRSPREPGWGEEPTSSWGHLVAGPERRAVPTLPGAYGLFYAGMASFVLDDTPPPVDIGDAVVTAEVIEAALVSAGSGTVAALP